MDSSPRLHAACLSVLFSFSGRRAEEPMNPHRPYLIEALGADSHSLRAVRTLLVILFSEHDSAVQTPKGQAPAAIEGFSLPQPFHRASMPSGNKEMHEMEAPRCLQHPCKAWKPHGYGKLPSLNLPCCTPLLDPSLSSSEPLHASSLSAGQGLLIWMPSPPIVLHRSLYRKLGSCLRPSGSSSPHPGDVKTDGNGRRSDSEMKSPPPPQNISQLRDCASTRRQLLD